MTTDPFDLAARFAESAPRGAADPDPAGEAVTNAFSEASYVCDACGEEIVVPVDPAAGAEQEYVEDCPIRCRPNLLTVAVGPRGGARCTARCE